MSPANTIIGDELIRQVEFSYLKLNTKKWNLYQDTWEVEEGFVVSLIVQYLMVSISRDLDIEFNQMSQIRNSM